MKSELLMPSTQCDIAWLTVETDNPFQEYYMLVTFTADAYADSSVWGCRAYDALNDGSKHNRARRDSDGDVPAARSRLEAAIEAEKASPPVEDKDADKPVVSMAHRTLPLIDLLAATE